MVWRIYFSFRCDFKAGIFDPLSAFQDKLLEEMWKQQDSLEGPTATAAEMPAAPEVGGGSEENSKDSNPLLERLRALEVKRIAQSTSYPSPNCSPFPHHSSCPFLSSLKCQIDRYIESATLHLIKCISLDAYRNLE